MARKLQTITFKAESSLLEALDGMQNRSAFIRNAVLAALDSACPLCRGTGILTPGQRRHWDDFSHSHRVARCDRCRELVLTCEQDAEGGCAAGGKRP